MSDPRVCEIETHHDGVFARIFVVRLAACEFGAKDGLPAKVIYLRKRKNPDTGEVVEYNEEDRLQKPITIEGITSPWVIDHFVNSKQTSRIAYESIEYNHPVADSLFTKPATIKGLK